MGADYSIELISIEADAPQFIGHNKIVLGSVQTQLEFERAEHVAKYLKKLRQKGNKNTDETQLLEEAKGRAKSILMENELQLKQMEETLIRKEVLVKKVVIQILN